MRVTERYAQITGKAAIGEAAAIAHKPQTKWRRKSNESLQRPVE
jgi:hypothetical protein